MAFIPVINCAEVELRYICLAQRIENSLYFLHNDVIELADLQALLTYMDSWWYSGLRQYQKAELTLSEIFGRDLTEEGATSYSNTTHSGTAGASSSGQILPNNVSLCISFRTGFPGRSYRGRNYTCAMQTGYITGQSATSTYRNNIIAVYNNLKATAGQVPAGWTWVVVSRYHNSVPRSAGVCTTINSVLAVDDYLDSQRRRLSGRGS